MSPPEIVAIAAVARNGVIGADGDIPWRVPADWRRFKRLTTGHTLVMGRKTYDSIGRPLPDRTTVVVTRDRRWRGEGVLVAPTIDEALRVAAEREAEQEAGTVWVAGGGEVYAALWDRLDRLELTEVDVEPEGSVRLPTVEVEIWRESGREAYAAADGVPAFAFVTYGRRVPEKGLEPSRPAGTGT